jgi:gamma-butyrobetaine dioxygenase
VTRPEIIDTIFELFRRRGDRLYGEGVTLARHSLQTATQALAADAGPEAVAAALLHDIGYLVADFPDDVVERGIETEHEKLGSVWLSRYFGAAVTEPVRLHVAAKRYLAQADPGYGQRLSEASRRTLETQGGPMSAAEAARFLAGSGAAAAIALRAWDDAAKVAGRETEDLEHFRPYLEAAMAKADPAAPG